MCKRCAVDCWASEVVQLAIVEWTTRLVVNVLHLARALSAASRLHPCNRFLQAAASAGDTHGFPIGCRLCHVLTLSSSVLRVNNTH